MVEWLIKHRTSVLPFVEPSEKEVMENLFQLSLLFKPIFSLVTQIEDDEIRAADVFPLLFQCFKCYDDIFNNFFYDVDDKWKIAFKCITDCLWNRTLGGKYGGIISLMYCFTQSAIISYRENQDICNIPLTKYPLLRKEYPILRMKIAVPNIDIKEEKEKGVVWTDDFIYNDPPLTDETNIITNSYSTRKGLSAKMKEIIKAEFEEEDVESEDDNDYVERSQGNNNERKNNHKNEENGDDD
jgi:hypothetical protein